ncbi:response regulator [Rothia sp. P6271]|uniref:response regulator n=1 Tax=unclassified Rothia (in: high G+C Gram-positive bacteria) TaxID=2689056 RepID=UPI003AC1BA8D
MQEQQNSPLRVLLVDDQSLLRMGFRLVLENAGIEVVGEASHGQEAIEMVQKHHPDVVLMDIRMPVMDGITATQKITSMSDSKVIILTTFDLDEYAFSGLRAGASAFVLKDIRPEDLIAAIHTVNAGESMVTPTLTARLVKEYAEDSSLGRAAIHGYQYLIDSLTAREKDMVGAIAEGLSNAEIAQQFFLSETTVKTHVRSILSKLNLRDRVQVVVFAYESGMVRPHRTSGQ